MDLFNRCAETYDQFRQGNTPYLFTIVTLLRQFHSKTILDIGCGTGNLFYQISPYWRGNCIGIDISENMLKKAKEKTINASWLCADVRCIPCKDNSCDGITGIYVLHLLKDIPDVLRECRRVIKNGWIAIVSAPHQFIENHPLNQYFPSFSKIDLSRFPKEEEIVNMLEEAGFSNIRQEYYIFVRDWLSEEYLHKIRSKFISTLHLIPQDEFNIGIEKMERDVLNGLSEKLIPWESVLITGFCE